MDSVNFGLDISCLRALFPQNWPVLGGLARSTGADDLEYVLRGLLELVYVR
jgi:hypothetical protein